MNGEATAKELGITRQAVYHRKKNDEAVKKKLQESFEDIFAEYEFTRHAAAKFALDKLHDKTTHESLQHKWFITITELCDWRKTGTDTKQIQQTFIGSEFSALIKKSEHAQMQSGVDRG